MTPTVLGFTTGPARRLLLWCLLAALPIFGLSGTVIQLLGHQHFHKAAAIATAPTAVVTGWEYFTRLGYGDTRQGKRLAARDLHAAPHSHAGLARHHHPGGDPGIVVIDGPGQDDGLSDSSVPPGSGLAAQMAVLPPLTLVPPPADGHGRWRPAEQAALSQHDPHRLDRPPKA